MKTRTCNIAVISATELGDQKDLIGKIKNTAVSSFTYKTGEPISTSDLQTISGSDLVYFFFDADPNNQDARKAMIPFLRQIDAAQDATSGTGPTYMLVGTIPTAKATKEQTEAVGRLKKNLVALNLTDFTVRTELVCVTYEKSTKRFKGDVAGDAQEKTNPLDKYGVVEAVPAPQPVPPPFCQLPESLASSGSAIPDPLSQAFQPLPPSTLPEINLTLAAAMSDLDKAIQTAENKLRKQKEELDNLKTLKTQAAALDQAHLAFQKDSKNEGALLLAAKNFTQTAGKIMDGKSETKKIVGGAIMAVFAVLLILASIPLYLCVPPLAVAGTALGVNVLTGTAALLLGSLMVGLGIFSVRSGREQGVALESKHVMELAAARP